MIAMVDVDEVAAKFMAVVPQNRQQRVHAALAVVLPAYSAGTIYNADYQDAKFTLDNAVADAYDEHVEKPFLWGKGYTPESEISTKLGLVAGLYSIVSFAKKLDKLKPPGAYGDALRSFADAVLPLAQLMNELKAKVVKGRKPNPEAAARRAAMLSKKKLRTCACCFRDIAVLGNGLIADHGYRLPRQWMKTASCPGRLFKPLEVSSEGLSYMVDVLTKDVASISKRKAGAKNVKSLTHTDWHGMAITVTPESPDWDVTFRNYKLNLERELDQAQRGLDDYKARLASWKPAEVKESALRPLVAELRSLLS